MNPAASAAPPTLLCVDDEANILAALRRLFRPAGYRILTAPGGAAGLQALEAEAGAVDLVISDMRMPEMDGAEFLARVRERWPATTRLLLTGYADIESTVAAINEGGIYRYIAKPWNDAEVLLTVRDALERRALQREKERLEALTRAQNEELRALNDGLERKVSERTTELAQANERLRSNFLTSIRVFSNLIELRAGSVAGHSRRVADLARRLAGHLGLEAHAVQDIFVAALLHDIGKIGLPDRILDRPYAQVAGEDRAALQLHPKKGEQVLMALEDLRGAAHLIRSHHERHDGKGFPAGLVADEIPIGARILALANDFDGLRQGALNGKRYSEQDAAHFIAEERGRRYHPDIVDAFLALTGALPAPALTSRALHPADLKPGMVLASDLISPDGVLLLAADYVLDEGLIRQIRDFEASDGNRITLHVLP